MLVDFYVWVKEMLSLLAVISSNPNIRLKYKVSVACRCMKEVYNNRLTHFKNNLLQYK